MKKITLLLFAAFSLSLGIVRAEVRITGTVTDAGTGKPLHGTTVIMAGTPSIFTSADADGKYSIAVPEEGAKLSFSHIGFETQEVDIAGLSRIDVKMKQSEQVVVSDPAPRPAEMVRTRRITGTVTSANTDEPLIGASVVVADNLSLGTYTGIDGSYAIDVPEGSEKLLFSYIGFESNEVKIKRQEVINVKISGKVMDGASRLYYRDPNYREDIRKRIASTSICTVVRREAGLGRPNDLSVLQGRLSGMYLGYGETPVVRGGSFADGRVKYIVDGIPDLTFNMSEAESIIIYKDAAAMAVTAGTGQASGGVMAVTTKTLRGTPSAAFSAWMGTRKLAAMTPGDQKGGFGTLHKSSLVQHYDAVFGYGADNSSLTAMASYDNIDTGIDGIHSERISARLKAEASLAKWARFGQHIAYSDTRDKYAIPAKDNGSSNLFTGSTPSERAASSSLLTIMPWSWLKVKSSFTYDKGSRDTDLSDIITLRGLQNRTPYHYDHHRRAWENAVDFNRTWDRHNVMIHAAYRSTATGVRRTQGSDTFKRSENYNEALFNATYSYDYGTRNVTASLHRLSSPVGDIGDSHIWLPTVGVMWNPRQERFFGHSNAITNLRIFANWGRTASIGIDPSEHMQLYTIPFAVDPGLKWQTTEQLSAGIDFYLLDNRLGGSAHFFDKKTANIPMLMQTGKNYYLFTCPCSITNRGWEFTLNTTIGRKYQTYIEANFTTYDITGRPENSTGLYPGWNTYTAPDYYYGLRISSSLSDLTAEVIFHGAGNARLLTADWDYAKVDYFGLKTINVNYFINMRRVIRSSSYYTGITVFANAENLFTKVSSDFTPNASPAGFVDNPTYRMFSFGVKLSF